MPDNEQFKFGIEFETNAGSVAKQIDDLDKSQDRLDRNDQKRKKRQKKDRTPQEVAAVYMKMLKKYAKLQQQTDKGKIKDNKTLLDLEKQRFNTVRKMIKLVATTGAVSWFFGKVSESAQYGKNLNIASLSTGIDSSTINALSMLTKKYGGGLESTQGDLRRINDIIWNLTNLGYDSSLDNAMTYFPKELMSMFYKDGQAISDPMQVISNIQEAAKGKDASTLQRLSELLGVSNALILALANNTTSIENSIEAEKQRLSIEQNNVKKLADLQHAMDAFDTTFTNEFASQLSSVLGEDFKRDFQDIAKGIAAMAAIPLRIYNAAKTARKFLPSVLPPPLKESERKAIEKRNKKKANELGIPYYDYEQREYLTEGEKALWNYKLDNHKASPFGIWGLFFKKIFKKGDNLPSIEEVNKRIYAEFDRTELMRLSAERNNNTNANNINVESSTNITIDGDVYSQETLDKLNSAVESGNDEQVMKILEELSVMNSGGMKN